MKLVTLILPMFKLESVYNIMQQTILTLVSVEIYTYINVFISPLQRYMCGWEMNYSITDS